MGVWLLCFGLLFALAELILWLKEIMLPLPIYILAGAFLAIASNYWGSSNLSTSVKNELQSFSQPQLTQTQTTTAPKPLAKD